MTVAASMLVGCASPQTQETSAISATPTPAVAAPPAPQVAPQPPSTQASAQASTTGPQPGDDEIVCRKDKTLGTRIGKRVCKTRAQLRMEEESARQMMKRRDVKGNNGVDPNMGTG
jgi:hypothetical protein